MQTKAPTRKVVAATGAGGLGVYLAEIVLYCIELAHDLPDHIEMALTALIVAAFVAAVGYLMPPSSEDRPIPN